ncbi:unnamed protein product [Effrenium voratum]|nr:unnamed protein product [Effrenium voratum]
MALKAAVTWGGLDWLARRASQDARLSETLLTELRCCANELHEDIARSEASLAALQRQRLLRACLRTWRFRCSAWSPRSLLPVALRYWLSLSLVRWAVLARRRQLPRFFCGRRLMLQEALSWRVVWTCFAAWRSLLEADAQARAKSLLAAVRALGAFDLQIVQLHRVTGTGLAALQVKLLDLSGAPLQTALAAKVEFLPCGFCCRRHRYFLLLRTASFNAWRTRAARLRKAPDRSPLLRLVLDTWRARSRAESV